METTQQLLGQRLPRDTRELFYRRCDLLISDLNYYAENRREKLVNAQKAGWSVPRLRVLLILNAFYQIVLAPLESSARQHNTSPLARTEVIYGTTSFGADWRVAINAAYNAFQSMVGSLQIDERLLSSQRTEDVLYQAGRYANDN